MFYPISWLDRLNPDAEKLFSDYEKINEYKNKISDKQKAEGREPYSRKTVEANENPFWGYCTKCGHRIRSFLKDGKSEVYCKICDYTTTGEVKKTSPDIIYSQILTPMHLGITARLVGHVHPYAEVADTYLADQDIKPPKRYVLSTHPVFHGIGDPPDGEGRCSIIRAAIEAEYEDIGRALAGGWNENPQIYSHFHKNLI